MDDSIKCEWVGFAPNRSEWKHQIRWDIKDLRSMHNLLD
jgi:hypothetical protein